MRPIIFLIASLPLASGIARAGDRIDDRRFEFQLTIPDGFVAAPNAIQGDVIHAYQKPPVRDGGLGTLILIRRMNGLLGREDLKQDQMEKFGKDVTTSKQRWKLKGLDVDTFRIPEVAGGIETVTFNVQVPLKPEAIQITVVGERADEAELERIVTELMSNLTGHSNWLTTGERVGKLTSGLLQFGCCCITPLLAVVLVVILSLRKSRKQKERRRRRYLDDDDRDDPRPRDRDD